MCDRCDGDAVKKKKKEKPLTTERHPAALHHCYPVAAEFYPFPSQVTDAEVDDPSQVNVTVPH